VRVRFDWRRDPLAAQFRSKLVRFGAGAGAGVSSTGVC
jgi:hypothetical protein